MMKILVVFGTRPEAIKTAPVILALRQRKDCQVKVCFTGQHRDMAMPFMELFGVEPEISFRIDNASLSGSVAEILQKMDGLLNAEKFDWVLVQGDTNTVLAASLAAFYHRVKVGHIEAGLRTHRKMFPYPEEMNRLLTTRIADLHFAPTPQARENLLREGMEEKDIVVTGNTVIDALWIILKKLENDPESEKRLLEKFPFLAPEKKLVLVTCHRRENQGNGLETLCGTLKKSVAGHEELQFVYPVHLSPAVRGVVLPLLQGEKNIHCVEPLDYLDFVQLLRRSFCVMTDSGGVQEEAAALGKPIILLRDETERPEIARMTEVIPTGIREEKILEALKLLLKERACEGDRALLGDGSAAGKIIEEIFRRTGENA